MSARCRSETDAQRAQVVKILGRHLLNAYKTRYEGLLYAVDPESPYSWYVLAFDLPDRAECLMRLTAPASGGKWYPDSAPRLDVLTPNALYKVGGKDGVCISVGEHHEDDTRRSKAGVYGWTKGLKIHGLAREARAGLLDPAAIRGKSAAGMIGIRMEAPSPTGCRSLGRESAAHNRAKYPAVMRLFDDQLRDMPEHPVVQQWLRYTKLNQLHFEPADTRRARPATYYREALGEELWAKLGDDKRMLRALRESPWLWDDVGLNSPFNFALIVAAALELDEDPAHVSKLAELVDCLAPVRDRLLARPDIPVLVALVRAAAASDFAARDKYLKAL